MTTLPKIIQGGMGVAVSTWELAKAVSLRGQLGVVSGTGIGLVFLARLQKGDEGGHVRRALLNFPIAGVGQKYIDKYYVEGGLPANVAYKRPTMWTVNPPRELVEVTILANFVEVWLAKEGHNNPVGINLLEKVQLPNLASVYGAMLAGVDYVIMGAGIPMQIPGALDKLAEHEAVSYRLDVLNAGDEDIRVTLDPEQVFPGIAAQLGSIKRPQFLPIVSSVVLALALLKRASGEINGFVIEMPTAGGHNAPPRGEMKLNERGEPIYGKKDDVNLAKFREMGLPFWLAGGYGSAQKLQEALSEGAAGIQVGTAFAYCQESGFEPQLRDYIVGRVLEGESVVRTDPLVSPTGFPFKVVQVPGTLSEQAVYEERPRVCDVGYLRHLYKDDNGKIGYRCPAEPVDAYVKKGGKVEDTEGRVCLCNNLGAAAGWPQARPKYGDYIEPSIITSGDDLPNITQFIAEGTSSYTANDVIDVLLGEKVL